MRQGAEAQAWLPVLEAVKRDTPLVVGCAVLPTELPEAPEFTLSGEQVSSESRAALLPHPAHLEPDKPPLGAVSWALWGV